MAKAKMPTPKNVKGAEDVTSFYKSQETLMQPLCDQFEEDYARWRIEEQEYEDKPATEDKLVTPKPRIFADKLGQEFSSGKLKLNIPIYKDRKSEREAANMTVQAAYGLLGMADEILVAQPLGKPVQGSASWHIVNRGILACRCWLCEEKRGKETVLVVDVAIWDILNTRWSPGKWGLSRICHERKADVKQFNQEYKLELTGDSAGNLAVYEHCDEDDIVVVAGGEIVRVVNHGLGYVPARIFTVGNTPYIQSKQFTDTIKDVAESAYSKTRQIWDADSRILSYYMTIVAQAVHTPIVGTYDSTKGGTGPPVVKTDPWAQKNITWIDIGKGQGLAPLFKPAVPQDAQVLLDRLGQLESDSTAPPILYGRQDQPTTAQGTSMLIHAGLTALKNGKNTLEQLYGWLSNEVVKQYKQGEFTNTRFQAVDGAEKKFAVDVDREKLVTDRKIEAVLDIFTATDEMQNIGMAVSATKSGLVSKQTAREKWLSIEDTDAEQAAIDREAGEELTGVKLRKLQAALIEDGDKAGAAWVQHELDMITDAMMQQMAESRQQIVPPSGEQERLPGSAPMPQPPMPMQPGLQDMGEGRPMKPETMMRRVRR